MIKILYMILAGLFKLKLKKLSIFVDSFPLISLLLSVSSWESMLDLEWDNNLGNNSKLMLIINMLNNVYINRPCFE